MDKKQQVIDEDSKTIVAESVTPWQKMREGLYRAFQRWGSDRSNPGRQKQRGMQKNKERRNRTKTKRMRKDASKMRKYNRQHGHHK